MPGEIKRWVMRRSAGFGCALLLGSSLAAHTAAAGTQGGVDVSVRESTIYTTTDPHNGAGPLWGYNASNIARTADAVWVTGLSTVPGLPPLNNTQCKLYKHTDAGWSLVFTLPGLTREPCPIGVARGNRLVISTNATLNPPGTPGGGPAQPGIWEYDVDHPEEPPVLSEPRWRQGAQPRSFTEHSYRSMAIDGARGELFLLQNIGDSHAEWTFRDGRGQWSSQGRIDWPIVQVGDRERPLRVAYVVALVSNRAVHLMGVSDVFEPNPEWRRFKSELTGSKWDYVFRRLYYTWTPDVTQAPFRPWVELANHESTAGWIVPGDLWLAPDGTIHAVWSATLIDERLRDRYFPDQRQRREIGYATLREGRIMKRRRLIGAQEGQPLPYPSSPRLQPTPDGRLFLAFAARGQGPSARSGSSNYVAEIVDGMLRSVVRMPLETPINPYVVATPRLGNAPSYTLDMEGQAEQRGEALTLRHVRVQLRLSDQGRATQ